MKAPKIRYMKPWTAAELRSMRRCAAKGDSARDFAARIGRTRGAVAFKAMVEGVSFHNVKQPAGVQKRRFAARRRLRNAPMSVSA